MLVIGAGPAGLASVACLRRQGVTVDWVDLQGQVGGAYRNLYPKITLASPARWIGLPGCPISVPGEYVTVQDYLDYLTGYAQKLDVQPRQARVSSLQRMDAGYRATFDHECRDYAAVVTATGMDGLVWPDCARPEGGPVWLHSSQWQGPQAYVGQRLLIIGRGVSAVEIAEESVRAGLKPVVSCRGKVHFSPQRLLGRDVHDFVFCLSWLPRWLARGYCHKSPTFTGYDRGFGQYQRAGLLLVRPPVQSFQARQATFTDGSQAEFDVVICATGYRYAMEYLPSQIARSRGDGHPLANAGESTNCPGLFFMGVHCARGVSSQFLRGMALDAPAIASQLSRRL